MGFNGLREFGDTWVQQLFLWSPSVHSNKNSFFWNHISLKYKSFLYLDLSIFSSQFFDLNIIWLALGFKFYNNFHVLVIIFWYCSSQIYPAVLKEENYTVFSHPKLFSVRIYLQQSKFSNAKVKKSGKLSRYGRTHLSKVLAEYFIEMPVSEMQLVWHRQQANRSSERSDWCECFAKELRRQTVLD